MTVNKSAAFMHNTVFNMPASEGAVDALLAKRLGYFNNDDIVSFYVGDVHKLIHVLTKPDPHELNVRAKVTSPFGVLILAIAHRIFYGGRK